MIIVYGFIGWFISLFFGGVFTTIFHKYILTKKGQRYEYEHFDMILGTVERIFFTLAVTFSVGGAIVGMMAWISMKMITNRHWQRKPVKSRDRSLCSLLSSMVSMSFALIGGLFCRWPGP